MMQLTSGVPQGLGLGLTLWNILYGDLPRLPLQRGIEFIAFVDDDLRKSQGDMGSREDAGVNHREGKKMDGF